MVPTTEISSPLLSVKEAAVYLGMSKDWVYENMKKLIPHIKIGGSVKFRKGDLDRYIATRTFQPMNTKDVKTPIALREFLREPGI